MFWSPHANNTHGYCGGSQQVPANFNATQFIKLYYLDTVFKQFLTIASITLTLSIFSFIWKDIIYLSLGKRQEVQLGKKKDRHKKTKNKGASNLELRKTKQDRMEIASYKVSLITIIELFHPTDRNLRILASQVRQGVIDGCDNIQVNYHFMGSPSSAKADVRGRLLGTCPEREGTRVISTWCCLLGLKSSWRLSLCHRAVVVLWPCHDHPQLRT